MCVLVIRVIKSNIYILFLSPIIRYSGNKKLHLKILKVFFVGLNIVTPHEAYI